MAIKDRHRTGHIIKSFEAKTQKKRSFAIRFADSLTTLFGSIWFFLANVIFFTGWILINTGKVSGFETFDPFPFVLLITLVSLEAIVLTIIVLMSQNRQSHISTLREELELQVELITEKEITKVLSILKQIAEKQGIVINDPEVDEMLTQMDTSYIERELERQLNKTNETITTQVVNEVAEKVGLKK